MLRKSQKMMHISSSEEQQQQEKQQLHSSLRQTGQKYATPVKFGSNFKFQSQKITKNILRNQNYHDYQYTQVENNQNTSQNPIKFVGENYFHVENHTIPQNTHRSSQDDKQSQLSLLEKLNEQSQNRQKQLREYQNLDGKSKKKISINTKNLLKAQFEDSQSEQQTQSIAVRVQNNEQQQKKSQNQQHSDKQHDFDTIKTAVWLQKEPKHIFIRNKIKENQRLKLVLNREKKGLNFFLPQFDLIYPDSIKHVLSCKKQLGTHFQCLISLDNHNFSEKGSNIVGKIKGNFTNSVFNLIDQKQNAIICTTKFKQEANTTVLTPMTYQIYLLNDPLNYENLVGQSQGTFDRGLDQLYSIPINKNYISYFRNKKPQYHQRIKAYMLNFGGRVNKGSVKNFIIEDSKSGRQVLMFGKGQYQSFNLYLSFPFSPLIALFIVIPHFASKALCK